MERREASGVTRTESMADEAESTFLTRLIALRGRSYREQPAWIIALEGLAFTVIGVFITSSLVAEHAGVLSVLCASTALAHRFRDLLDENRDNIYVHQLGSVKTNLRTASRVLAMFLGIVVAYALTTVWLGEEGTRATFRYFLDGVSIGDDSIVTRRFGSFGPLLAHNLAVLGSFFALSFVYWGYGAVLALAWNACVWGTTLTILVVRGAAASYPATEVALAALSVGPHLILEAVAYLLGGLAGIFCSKALSKYRLSDPVFRSVMRAVLVLLVVAALSLVTAAGAESLLASR
jgi:Stage II sporulation protein M